MPLCSVSYKLSVAALCADESSMPGGPTIAEELCRQLRSRLRDRGSLAPLEIAISAAAERSADQRAWGLVTVAKHLRSDGDFDLAMLAIEAAVSIDAGGEPTRAAYTCAVAIHADRGELDTAYTLAEELVSESADPYALKALARVCWELWERTEAERYRVRLREIDSLLLDAQATHADRS